MNTGYLISQAERTPSRMEQRDIDATNAKIVASFVRLWQAVAAPVRGLGRLYREDNGVPIRAAGQAHCG